MDRNERNGDGELTLKEWLVVELKRMVKEEEFSVAKVGEI